MCGTVVILPVFAKTLLEGEGRFMSDPQAEKLYRLVNPSSGETMLGIVYEGTDEIVSGGSMFVTGAKLAWCKEAGLTPEGEEWLSQL